MKAFIGKYYKTAEAAIKAYDELLEDRKKNQSICELNGSYFIVGNSTIEAFNGVKRSY